MGNTPLGCLLQTLGTLGLKADIRAKCFKFVIPLGHSMDWIMDLNGTLDFNILGDISNWVISTNSSHILFSSEVPFFWGFLLQLKPVQCVSI